MIDVDLDHARRDRRWIGSIDDAWREQVGMERRRNERFGALPIPECQRRGTLLQDPVPQRRCSILLDDILNQQIVPFETDGGVASARVIPELSDRIARLLCQHIA